MNFSTDTLISEFSQPNKKRKLSTTNIESILFNNNDVEIFNNNNNDTKRNSFKKKLSNLDPKNISNNTTTTTDFGFLTIPDTNNLPDIDIIGDEFNINDTHANNSTNPLLESFPPAIEINDFDISTNNNQTINNTIIINNNTTNFKENINIKKEKELYNKQQRKRKKNIDNSIKLDSKKITASQLEKLRLYQKQEKARKEAEIHKKEQLKIYAKLDSRRSIPKFKKRNLNNNNNFDDGLMLPPNISIFSDNYNNENEYIGCDNRQELPNNGYTTMFDYPIKIKPHEIFENYNQTRNNNNNGYYFINNSLKPTNKFDLNSKLIQGPPEICDVITTPLAYTRINQYRKENNIKFNFLWWYPETSLGQLDPTCVPARM